MTFKLYHVYVNESNNLPKKRLNRVGLKSLLYYKLYITISLPQIHWAFITVPIEVGVKVIEISPPQQDRLGLSPHLQVHS